MNRIPTSPGHFSITTSDLEQAEQIYLRSIAKAKILEVADKRNFNLKMNSLDFQKVSLISNRINSRCRMEASLGEDDFRLALALHAPSYFSHRGKVRTASEKEGLIVYPGSRIRVDRISGSQTLVINTSYSILEDHFELLTDEHLGGSLEFSPDINLTRGPGAYLHELMSRLSYDVQYNNRLINEPGIKRGYGELILGAILALPHNHSSRLQPDDESVSAPHIVRQAEEYIRSHFNERVTISDLISVCQCSRKALFSSFKSSREYTPMAFLQEQRLQAVRRKLGEPDSPSQTVSEIAYECGFTHLGRFSEHYRRRFGERPSESLKKRGRED